MESEELIICPECGNRRPKTRQHILAKRYGTTLEGRNKKEECNECQQFFDTLTIEESKKMVEQQVLLSPREVNFNNALYVTENSKHTIDYGKFAVITTGSPIQSISVEAANTRHIQTAGSPVSLTFDSSAPPNKDKVIIKNNHSSDLVVYVSVIVTKPEEKS